MISNVGLGVRRVGRGAIRRLDGVEKRHRAGTRHTIHPPPNSLPSHGIDFDLDGDLITSASSNIFGVPGENPTSSMSISIGPKNLPEASSWRVADSRSPSDGVDGLPLASSLHMTLPSLQSIQGCSTNEKPLEKPRDSAQPQGTPLLYGMRMGAYGCIACRANLCGGHGMPC